MKVKAITFSEVMANTNVDLDAIITHVKYHMASCGESTIEITTTIPKVSLFLSSFADDDPSKWEIFNALHVHAFTRKGQVLILDQLDKPAYVTLIHDHKGDLVKNAKLSIS